MAASGSKSNRRRIRRIRFWLFFLLGTLVLIALALALGGPPIENRIYDSGIQAARLAVDMEPGKVATDGHGPLSYIHREGGDGPRVVLIHGFASEADSWLAMLRHLPRDWSILALDLPGHGDSPDSPDADYGLNALTETIHQATRNLELDQYHVLGTSLGGNLAIRLALAHPERVQSLGLIAPAAFPAPETSAVEKMLADGHNPLIVSSREDFDTMVDLIFHEPPVMPWPTARVLVRRAIERQPARQQIWEAAWDSANGLKHRLPQLAGPVFLLWGRNDQAVDISALQVFEQALTADRVDITVLEETGHSPMLEKPEETAAAYQQFLDSLPPADTSPPPDH